MYVPASVGFSAVAPMYVKLYFCEKGVPSWITGTQSCTHEPQKLSTDVATHTSDSMMSYAYDWVAGCSTFIWLQSEVKGERYRALLAALRSTLA